MQPDVAPMPRTVALRPRDARGFPVPAITPWRDGEPMFAATSVSRTLICAVERRCSICATQLGSPPVWRVVAAEEAVAMAAALANGESYDNLAPTAEAPGHLACMLYASMVCPFLARPNARRGAGAQFGDFVAPRGAPRGELDGIGGGVAGFETYEFEVADQVMFRFAGLVALHPHRLGAEHLTELRALLADGSELDDVMNSTSPPYLGSDEDTADRRAEMYR